MTATHNKKRTHLRSSLWEGEDLHITIEESVSSKKKVAVPPRTHSTSFFNASGSSEASLHEASPSQLAFDNRK